MKKYRQLPTAIQAVHYGGDNPKEVEALLEVVVFQNAQTKSLYCAMPEGELVVPVGFWVCIGSDSKVYCLSDPDFNRIYYRAWDQ